MLRIPQRFLFIFICLSFFGCSGRAPIFPQGNFDIVYQTEGTSHDSIGFFSNTTNESYIFESSDSLISPIYFSGQGLLTSIATRGFSNDPSVDIPGYFMVNNSISPVNGCMGEYSEEVQPYGDKVVSLAEGIIQIVDPKTCNPENIIFSQGSVGWEKEKIQISTFSLREQNPNLILSVYKERKYSLVRVNLETKEIYYYNKFGINPAISPDGKRIAYFGYDGIRIMNFDGHEDDQITFGASWENSNNENWSKPEWSSDGKKLLYHKCNLSGIKHCLSYSDYSIFIYELSSGIEEKIIDFGTNPSWVINN
jgi:hypothetical protein